MGLE
jgi:hypothetical protein